MSKGISLSPSVSFFTIPLIDSDHRKWTKQDIEIVSTVSYEWQEISISGKASNKNIAVAVAKYYHDLDHEFIETITNGIYFFSRLKKGDIILGLNNENQVERVGAVQSNNLNYRNAKVEIRWLFQDRLPVIAKFPDQIEKIEIQRFNFKQISNYLRDSSGTSGILNDVMNASYASDSYLLTEAKIQIDEPKKDPGGDIILFYGTNRKKLNQNNVKKFYGSEIGPLQVGSCTVSIPPGHKQGELERPIKILLWQLNENINKHVLLASIKELSEDIFYRWLQENISNTPNKSALIFIHGYNTTFEEAAWRAGQIAHDIPFNNGLTGFFSWPSSGETLDYVRDIELADSSINDFEQFIDDLVNKAGVEELHFIAHSMGNRILTNALNKISVNKNFIGKLKTINQIVLAAPDIDKDVFDKNVFPILKSLGARRTLYASDKDKALILSRQIRHDLIRIGEAGDRLYLAEGLDTVDASNVTSSGNNHSYMFETKELLTDIYLLLCEGLDPEKRRLQIRHKNEFKYWLFPE